MKESNTGNVFTDGQLAQIMLWYRTKTAWEIVDLLHEKYGLDVPSDQTVRRAIKSYGHLFETGAKIADVKVLKDVARTSRNASQTAKENRTILAALNKQDDILAELKGMITGLPKYVAKRPKPRPTKGVTSMTVEAMLSDLHFGKKTKTFNIEVARERLRLFTSVLLGEIERKASNYNVEHIVLAFLGDMIENALMHGKESATSCEFGNPEQVRYMIELLYAEVIIPLAETGIKLTIVAITGNHDREEERPTFNHPGKNSLTWIGYNAIKMLADQAGIKATWIIPEGVYATLDIYGTGVLYDHGDRIKGGNDKKSFMSHLVKRSAQVGRLLRCLRIGHWHEYSCLDNGMAIVNASLCGQDSYADVNGYASIPGQTINYYVQTKNRDNSYYHSLLVQL